MIVFYFVWLIVESYVFGVFVMVFGMVVLLIGVYVECVFVCGCLFVLLCWSGWFSYELYLFYLIVFGVLCMFWLLFVMYGDGKLVLFVVYLVLLVGVSVVIVCGYVMLFDCFIKCVVLWFVV